MLSSFYLSLFLWFVSGPFPIISYFLGHFLLNFCWPNLYEKNYFTSHLAINFYLYQVLLLACSCYSYSHMNSMYLAHVSPSTVFTDCIYMIIHSTSAYICLCSTTINLLIWRSTSTYIRLQSAYCHPSLDPSEVLSLRSLRSLFLHWISLRLWAGLSAQLRATVSS